MSRYLLSAISILMMLLAACGGNGNPDTVESGNPTTTVSFDFNDFTGVAVAGLFDVSIAPGPFSVQVTVDTHAVDSLNVRQEGQLLIAGLDDDGVHSQTRDITIVMPTLERIDLAALATGSIFDFNGSFLSVSLASLSRLDGQNVSYDLLIVNAVNLSFLTMEDISPLPAADLHLTGVSSATVNMMDNAVLTGTVEGKSTLSYYGSNVIIDVLVDVESLIRRLGPSRP